jgi:biopolymer transport protein ExbB
MLKLTTIISCYLLLSITTVSAQTISLENLLDEVRTFGKKEQTINQQRERIFKRNLQEQKNLLQTSEIRLQKNQELQNTLKKKFDNNEKNLTQLTTQLNQRSGYLGEVFGVAKQTASELQTILQDSLSSADNPKRFHALDFAESKAIPTLQELETLWYQLQLEMTASSQIKTFKTTIIDINGVPKNTSIIRFGSFTAATIEGKFLKGIHHHQPLKI